MVAELLEAFIAIDSNFFDHHLAAGLAQASRAKDRATATTHRLCGHRHVHGLVPRINRLVLL